MSHSDADARPDTFANTFLHLEAISTYPLIGSSFGIKYKPELSDNLSAHLRIESLPISRIHQIPGIYRSLHSHTHLHNRAAVISRRLFIPLIMSDNRERRDAILSRHQRRVHQ